MNLPTVVFGKTVCRITDPGPAWFQRSPDDPLECSQCGDTLTFTFLPRTDPETAGFAGSYSVPTGIRCNCSLIDSGSSTELSYHKELARDPVAVVGGPYDHLNL